MTQFPRHNVVLSIQPGIAVVRTNGCIDNDCCTDAPDSFVTIKSITNVTVDKGLVCVADTASDQLVTMSPIGEVTVPLDANTQLVERHEDGTRVKIELGTISAPVIDAQGNRFFVDQVNAQVVKFDPYGNVSRVITKDTEIRFEQQQ